MLEKVVRMSTITTFALTEESAKRPKELTCLQLECLKQERL